MRKVALELQPCCGNRSGIGSYAYELARRLRNGNNLEFVGNVFNFLGRNNNDTSLAEIQMPVRTQVCIPYGIYRRIWHVLPLFYSMMFQKAELSIFFNYIVPPRITGRVINTICDMTYLRYPETMDKRNLSRISKDILYSAERSDRIITISEFSKSEIHHLLGVPLEKISVIYSAASLSEKKADWQDLQRRYSITKPYLLYVGNMEPRKNLVRLLRAYRLIKKESGIPHQLVLAGGGGWRNEKLFQELSDLEKTGDVIRTGYVTPEEKNTLYTYASAFVFPSVYEGFGMPPLEAMSLGCPVVCANTASLPEVVGNAAELVDPMEIDSIAEGILRVIADEPYRTKLVQRGYAQAKKFNWDDSAKKLTQICREVLEES